MVVDCVIVAPTHELHTARITFMLSSVGVACVASCAACCCCSWTLALGEWIIKRLPLVKHIYSASKQVCVRERGGCEGVLYMGGGGNNPHDE